MRLQFGEVTDDGAGHWVVRMTRVHEDGSTEDGSHIFPKDALEWRAAEYGIDPADTNTLLDVILTEPHLSDEDRNDGAPDLATADTVDDARKAHLARCARVKLRYRMSTRLPALKRVREESPMNPEALEVKRQVVHEGREVLRRTRKLAALRAIDPEAERVRRLRESHGMINTTRRTR